MLRAICASDSEGLSASISTVYCHCILLQFSPQQTHVATRCSLHFSSALTRQILQHEFQNMKQWNDAIHP
ncbi:hypothetical protein GDO81_013695 [Engystomops pustulosus]|uniref:Uncharacterized protein n=1 Tax=Engystomops pustulosus TaxID=76066 RepID=A0AAV7B4W5_ENGPU|nr:hypothetical protein GDO81_013695 [Engystomops pustulosus]